jgi:hypothetical protein
MDELVNAAQELARLSYELQVEVDKFKIDDSVKSCNTLFFISIYPLLSHSQPLQE